MAVAPLVEILLEMLADPNALDHHGCTPLMICKTFMTIFSRIITKMLSCTY
jgi:hypothetical protein